ncbi:hypothetical protein DEIPH_ctg052orf0031 [Deinococcus phoenicis]|uniref:Uncharacterized protein n=1 Tax=Deinococcus phoenicis TaxID=1476583 RepID=A0A016QLQ5_9DEIO|nr:hypothetical protein [Deinococcus phoenicis]EYB67035.1 hypothetical protein DEIPH_ctg052orf0031 [Deinococcus phoenicis]
MSLHTRIRQLSRTPEGRAHLARWSGCGTDDWQQAFEQAGDYANARLCELHQAAPPVSLDLVFGGHEWYQAREARSAAIEAQVLAELEATL